MESMRQYVADAFETMLKRAHVEAKLKTGTLGCEVSLLAGSVCVCVAAAGRPPAKAAAE